METGKDLHGRLLPYFSDVIELRPPVYGYTAYVSSMFLGTGPIGIRAPAVLFGLLTIIAIYLLVSETTNDRRAALSAAFFLAIIPWHIHYSRVGWEPSSFLPFLLLATFFFIYGINRNRKYLIVIAFGLFSLTLYTYQAAPLYSFVFLASLILLNYRYFLKHKKLFFACCAISIMLTFPYIWTVKNEFFMYARAKNISTFKDGINLESLSVFAHNYISHLTPSFLFISGDPNPRHGLGTGVIYWVMLPFIILGVYGLLRSEVNRRHIIFLFIWFLSYPLAGSLTNDGVPHATRSLIGAPLYCFLGGYGLSYSYKLIKTHTREQFAANLFLVFIIASSLISLGLFTRTYFEEYPKSSYVHWGYGQKEIFNQIKLRQGYYKRVCIEHFNPSHEAQLVAYYLGKTNLDIIRDMDNPKCGENGTLIVISTNTRLKKPNTKLVDTIKAPTGINLYNIYEVK